MKYAVYVRGKGYVEYANRRRIGYTQSPIYHDLDMYYAIMSVLSHLRIAYEVHMP